MDYVSNMSAPAYPKRPGSPMAEHSMPAAKMSRTVGSSQLQINYLVRQKQDTLPLVTTDEKMPRILQLIGEYDGVLQRHESMASNLGACPLGPILLKRFERLFEGPPRVLKSHAKDPSVTWLDVVEFAQNRPEQFNLEKQRNGVRVCQFYHKQCRVEISEEDYVLIASGMPQKLIPPQPILEDEEKELGVMEILERNLGKLTQMADQISARARQLNHKLKTRRSAIMSRREAEADPRKTVLPSNDSPISPIDPTGMIGRPVNSIETSQSPPLGFTAVNNRTSRPSYSVEVGLGAWDSTHATKVLSSEGITPPSKQATEDVSVSTNGTPRSRRDSDMSKFLTEREKRAGMTEDTIQRQSLSQPVTHSTPEGNLKASYVTNPSSITARRSQEGLLLGREFYTPKSANVTASASDAGSPSVAIPSTPSSLLPQAKPSVFPKDDGGPFKAEMVARMENMARGERVIPPCDRCRRLQMDCMKNLTACQGCTKKHAKCSWKDVVADELTDPVDGQAHDRTKNTVTNTTVSHSKSASADPPSHNWGSLLTNNEDAGRVDGDAMQLDQDASGDTTSEEPTLTTRKQLRPASPVPVTSRSQTTSINPIEHSRSYSPKLDVRPPPLDQVTRDATNGRAQSRPSSSSVSHTQKSPYIQGQYDIGTPPGSHGESSKTAKTTSHAPKPQLGAETGNSDLDLDEGDRLQELARQVYRSASQSVRPGSS